MLKGQILTLVLVSCIMGQGLAASSFQAEPAQSVCPTIGVECDDDLEKDILTFKAKLSEGKGTHQDLSYKWTVVGGEIKEGQGTACITVTNFDLRRKSLTAVVEIGGLPEGCANRASCTNAVRCVAPMPEKSRRPSEESPGYFQPYAIRDSRRGFR